jgi:hypothetical protein
MWECDEEMRDHISLEPQLLNQLPVAPVLEKNGGPVFAQLGIERTYTILAIITIHPVDNGETADSIGCKKIFQDHFSLGSTVRIAFIAEGNLHQAIKMTGDLHGIAFPESTQYFFHRGLKRAQRKKRSKQKHQSYKSTHNGLLTSTLAKNVPSFAVALCNELEESITDHYGRLGRRTDSIRRCHPARKRTVC